MLLVGALAVTVVAVAALGAVGGAVAERARAGAAADLAALAAAESVALPPGLVLDPAAARTLAVGACATAAQVAERNGATLARCEVLGGGVVDVTAARDDVLARALAGPRPAG